MSRVRHNAEWMRHAALAALVALSLCVPSWARSQHGGAAGRPAAAPRAGGARVQAPRQQAAKPQAQARPNMQLQGRAQGGMAQRQGYPATTYAHRGYAGPGISGSAAPGSAFRATPYGAQVRPYAGVAPAGHLGDWLNQHRNLPAQEQERVLRSDPSFGRLPPGEQDRLVQQLHHVNQ